MQLIQSERMTGSDMGLIPLRKEQVSDSLSSSASTQPAHFDSCPPPARYRTTMIHCQVKGSSEKGSTERTGTRRDRPSRRTLRRVLQLPRKDASALESHGGCSNHETLAALARRRVGNARSDRRPDELEAHRRSAEGRRRKCRSDRPDDERLPLARKRVENRAWGSGSGYMVAAAIDTVQSDSPE